MKREIINPWTWADDLGFVQANAIGGHERVVICAGQTSNDPDGIRLHADDMRAQIGLALDNVETVLAQAGATLADVVRMKYYTTDVDRFFEAYDALTGRLKAAGCRPAATLLGVQRLAFPELMVEIEATAAI